MAVKTPGVYTHEQAAHPNTVVQVATAVPAFIGYTQIAPQARMPLKLSSMQEFEYYFGGPPNPQFKISADAVRQSQLDAPELPPAAFSVKGPQVTEEFELIQINAAYALYGAMQLFFLNEGGACYVTSIGSYEDAIALQPMLDALDNLKGCPEPTMIVIPEAMRLPFQEASKAQQQVLNHCGTKMTNRFAILDIPGGFLAPDGPDVRPVDRFRRSLGRDDLNFGAAYYPWLNTSVFSSLDFSFLNLDPSSRNVLRKLLKHSVGDDLTLVAEIDQISKFDEMQGPDDGTVRLDTALRAVPLYAEIMDVLASYVNVMPPAAAMAGVYTRVDETRGVWAAPANVSLQAVVSPAVTISSDQQDDLNTPMDGKSINSIRDFAAEGTLVWGARTLDGNSLDWRYVTVRRTINMLEESIRQAIEPWMSEPNSEPTWEVLRSMIEDFMTEIWRSGGLAGATPAQAFSVHIGLGETMTARDLSEGILRVSVKVAMMHPAEFIVIKIKQRLPKI